jgi:hypothetical protein
VWAWHYAPISIYLSLSLSPMAYSWKSSFLMTQVKWWWKQRLQQIE